MGVKRKSHWVTTMTVGLSEDASEQEVHDKTVLCYMGEAMCTSYFHVYRSKVEPALKQTCPFNQVEWLVPVLILPWKRVCILQFLRLMLLSIIKLTTATGV